MKRFLLFAIVTILIGLLVNVAGAGEPARQWQVLHHGTSNMPPHRVVPHHVDYHDIRWNPHRPPTLREAHLHRYQQLYPKFYYGFHGSFLYTTGMPTGDIGVRGLPW